MVHIPNELKYTETHEWVRMDGGNIATVGITHYAQNLLGDVVFIELPKTEDEISIKHEVGVIESVKAASDIYSPVSGIIVEVNENLNEQPELINSDPYGEGWIFKIELSDQKELEDLLDAEGYKEQIAE